MKKYIVFSWCDRWPESSGPRGGYSDYDTSFDDQASALDYIIANDFHRYQVVDRDTGKIIDGKY